MDLETQSIPEAASVVIPTLNAAGYLPALLDRLLSQQPSPPMEIILVDSSSTDNTRDTALSFERVKVIPIARFSHGGARNLGARTARGEFVVFMSQDAMPVDNSWLANLLASFSDEQVAAAYSRQVPRDDAPPPERFFIEHHFPSGKPARRVKPEGRPPAFEDVFFSNVSSAARRELVLKFPFDEDLIMSEDQQFARDLLSAGYAVVYQPGSAVLHSHRYSLVTVFKRYFDSVYSLTQLFADHDMGTSVGIGLRYLREETGHIIRRHPAYLPRYFFYTLAKTAGTIAGHFANRMPRAWLKRLSMHSYHWTR